MPALAGALLDGEPLVRRHAAWALGEIGTDASRRRLAERLDVEPDPEVKEEIAAALAGGPGAV